MDPPRKVGQGLPLRGTQARKQDTPSICCSSEADMGYLSPITIMKNLLPEFRCFDLWEDLFSGTKKRTTHKNNFFGQST